MLCHNIFHICMIHILLVLEIILMLNPVPFHSLLSIHILINKTTFTWWTWFVFEIILLDLCLLYGLRCELLYDFYNPSIQVISLWPLRLIYNYFQWCLVHQFNIYHNLVIQQSIKWWYYMHEPTLTVHTAL